MRIDQLAKLTADAIINNGGATINPETGKQPIQGYAVSLKGYEWRVPRPVQKPALQRLCQAWLIEHAAKLSRPSMFIGAWLDPETLNVVLDVSAVITTRAHAFLVAQRNKQQAIYSLHGKRACDVPAAANKPAFGTWQVWNETDPNDAFTVEAHSSHDAAVQALSDLGWLISDHPSMA